MNAHTSDPATAPSNGFGRRVLRTVAMGIAIALQAVLLVPFTVASGLLAPLWAVIVLYLLWLVAAGTLWVVARHQPLAAPLVPLANGSLLFGLLVFGESVLGWTA
jgi:hypothetical protein